MEMLCLNGVSGLNRADRVKNEEARCIFEVYRKVLKRFEYVQRKNEKRMTKIVYESITERRKVVDTLCTS